PAHRGDESAERQAHRRRAVERHQARRAGRARRRREGPCARAERRRRERGGHLHRHGGLQRADPRRRAPIEGCLMTSDLLALMWVPFLMCLVLTGIHAYLGFHVIAREVVFVDIALAQIAALGATAAFLFGFELETWESYLSGLAFTIAGAAVLALTRSRERRVSQEAVIGVVYAVSSAAAVLLADRSPAGN